MNKAMKILNIAKIWNKKSDIKNGEVYEVEFSPQEQKFYFVDPKDAGEYMRDIHDGIVWADQSDIDREFLEEYFYKVVRPLTFKEALEIRQRILETTPEDSNRRLALNSILSGSYDQYPESSRLQAVERDVEEWKNPPPVSLVYRLPEEEK